MQGRVAVPSSHLGMSDISQETSIGYCPGFAHIDKSPTLPLQQTSDMTRHELANPTRHSYPRDTERSVKA